MTRVGPPMAVPLRRVGLRVLRVSTYQPSASRYSRACMRERKRSATRTSADDERPTTTLSPSQSTR